MTGGNESAEVLPLADYLLGVLPAGELVSLSTDRGFSSIENRQILELEIPEVVMPKKGKLSEADRKRQQDKKWRKAANAHSAVESNINALEHHGLDRCPDKGESNYKRYVGLGVLSYNLHRIGGHLQEKELETKQKIKQNIALKLEKRRLPSWMTRKFLLNWLNLTLNLSSSHWH